MSVGDSTLRHRITDAVCSALRPLPHVLAGWESGSAAFNLVDEYSDIDLNFLLKDGALGDPAYAVVESALESVSPIAVRHTEPPGRYFKLVAGGDFLLVDVCMFRTGEFSEVLDVERHGKVRPLFDKGQWLLSATPSPDSQTASRAKRREDLQAWFSVSQCFVRKAMLRGQEVEAVAAFRAYTLKPPRQGNRVGREATTRPGTGRHCDGVTP